MLVKLVYASGMGNLEITDKQLKKYTDQAYWLGIGLGLLFGFIAGFAIGYANVGQTIIIPLTEGVKI